MRALVALGANLGDRRQTLDRAVEQLAAHPDIHSLARSRWHETAPVGGPTGQGTFLNGAVAFDTSLSSEQLLAALHEVEHALGRVREQRWEARVLDLDLLLHGDEVCFDHSIAVPHPRMAFRRFVLAPGAEVAADMLHPLVGRSVGQLLAHLDATPPYVALAGGQATDKTTLAQNVAQALSAQSIRTTLVFDPAATSGSAGSAGPTDARAIELISRRGGILNRNRARWPADTLAISDFWFDESLAHAQAELNSPALAQWIPHWQAVRQQVVLPRLVVMLDTPPAAAARVVLAQRASGSQAPVSGSQAENLLRLTVSGAAGPVLYLAAETQQQQLDEIVAAILAMS